jgi:hypothetical protein
MLSILLLLGLSVTATAKIQGSSAWFYTGTLVCIGEMRGIMTEPQTSNADRRKITTNSKSTAKKTGSAQKPVGKMRYRKVVVNDDPYG